MISSQRLAEALTASNDGLVASSEKTNVLQQSLQDRMFEWDSFELALVRKGGKYIVPLCHPRGFARRPSEWPRFLLFSLLYTYLLIHIRRAAKTRRATWRAPLTLRGGIAAQDDLFNGSV